MAEPIKKPYRKPELTQRKMELGVYGNYDEGKETGPFLPVEAVGFRGDATLDR